MIDPGAARTWPWPDVVGTLAIQRRWWHRLVRDRPAVGAAVAVDVETVAAALADALADLGRVPDAPCDGLGSLDLVELRTASLLDALGGRRSVRPPDVAAERAAHVVTDRILDAMRRAGRDAVAVEPPSPAVGTVVRLSVGSGGVPKGAVDRVTVDGGGAVGDRQGDRDNHGRPWQALCLWSAEVIDALAAEGHPVAPGTCGENVTVAGIDWATVRPGVRLHLGPDVVAEVSGEATPCRKIAGSFLGGRFNRVDHDRHPGWSRAYAWVRAGGVVTEGDPVTLS